ncbi:MAG: flagellar motor switch protein FliG, partial [Terriglobales bacterium]
MTTPTPNPSLAHPAPAHPAAGAHPAPAPPAGGKPAAGAAGLSGLRKAAILLVLLGDDAASLVCRGLPEGEMRLLTQEISALGYIEPAVAAQVMEEYYRLTVTESYLSEGGAEYARKLLVRAFGEDAARGLLEQVEIAREAQMGNFDTLHSVDFQQLAKFLEDEHPQTIALILAHLGSKAAALLALLPAPVRAQAIRRLAEMRQFSPEMAQKISQILHSKFQAMGEQSRRTYAGVKAVADILNHTDPAAAKAILQTLEQDDANMALTIRNLMFTFDDFVSLPDAGLRELLGQADKKVLATALKGASAELKDKIFQCMSSRAGDMMREDMEAMGPVRGREVSHAQQEIVTLARKLEAEGKLALK